MSLLRRIYTILILGCVLAMGIVLGEEKPHAANLPAAASAQTMESAVLIKESLDQPNVHELYNNGDFEPIIALLEGFIKRNKTYSQSDSIFIAKHLAVVYSANPLTREKGKYYMFRLLELLPSAKLIDMYVSDEVDRIFDKVREEFVTRNRAFGIDSSKLKLPTRPETKTNPPAKMESKKDHGWIIWTCIAGGTALFAGGGFLWYQNQDKDSTPKPESLDIKVITPKN